MFLIGVLGVLFWIRSKRWFKSYLYRYRLMFRILVQLCITGLITMLSTAVVSAPRFYGDVSTFLPLSYPLTVHWGISVFMVWPPHHYYSISVFGLELTGGGLGSGFGSLTAFKVEIFLNSMPLFLLLNVVFTWALILVSETLKMGKIRIINR